MDNVTNLLVYASGFAAGNILGGIIEEKMAVGLFTVQVITKVNPLDLADALREKGFGVTVIEGTGREGIRYICNVMLKRKDYPCLMEFIDKWDKCAFTMVFDARKTKGGFMNLLQKK